MNRLSRIAAGLAAAEAFKRLARELPVVVSFVGDNMDAATRRADAATRPADAADPTRRQLQLGSPLERSHPC